MYHPKSGESCYGSPDYRLKKYNIGSDLMNRKKKEALQGFIYILPSFICML